VAYEFGLGVPKNSEKARELYQKAAAQNNEHAKEGLNRLSRGSFLWWVYLITAVVVIMLRKWNAWRSKR
jgi:TPR repeat protein